MVTALVLVVVASGHLYENATTQLQRMAENTVLVREFDITPATCMTVLLAHMILGLSF